MANFKIECRAAAQKDQDSTCLNVSRIRALLDSDTSDIAYVSWKAAAANAGMTSLPINAWLYFKHGADYKPGTQQDKFIKKAVVVEYMTNKLLSKLNSLGFEEV